MATVGTVTVEVTPILPQDATEQIETAVRAAIAEALRKLADGLVATPNEAVKEDRYYVEQINGIWGVRDRETPDEWAPWDDDDESRDDASAAANRLNRIVRADRRDDYMWAATGEAA